MNVRCVTAAFALSIMLLTVACEPKSPEELRRERVEREYEGYQKFNRQMREKLKRVEQRRRDFSERLPKLEGKSLIVTKGLSNPYSWVIHIRQDCPETKVGSDLPSYEIIQVTVRKGQLVDKQGVTYDSGTGPCYTCVK